jgi:hypothetical protein
MAEAGAEAAVGLLPPGLEADAEHEAGEAAVEVAAAEAMPEAVEAVEDEEEEASSRTTAPLTSPEETLRTSQKGRFLRGKEN